MYKKKKINQIKPKQNPGEFEGMVVQVDSYGFASYYHYAWADERWTGRGPLALDLPEEGIKKGEHIGGSRVASITLMNP